MADQSPIIFNRWKHYWQHYIAVLNGEVHISPQQFFQGLKLTGDNLMDMYEGPLTEGVLREEVLACLEVQDCLAPLKYDEWIGQGRGYQSLTLSDGSHWVLRRGHHWGAYIHIHPGRYSPHTFRVKSTSLKTATAFLFLHPDQNVPSLHLLNDVRQRYLNLSPLKDDRAGTAIFLLIQKLQREITP
ncbi:hypothetical protein AB9P05_15535 [Roseivirga sp. BDSF3-8]|uniref:hypothetical protein n=1 Tax=Roseivirga sp. BDSF3-8 TaxID=3241598 RepID=UPI0035327010